MDRSILQNRPSSSRKVGYDTRQRIGAMIRARRIALGWPLRTLAEELKISASHLSRIERGLTVPSYPVYHRLSTAIGVDPNALITEEKKAKEIDREIESWPTRHGLSWDSWSDLLQLAPTTRAELVALVDRQVAP